MANADGVQSGFYDPFRASYVSSRNNILEEFFSKYTNSESSKERGTVLPYLVLGS